MGRILLILPFFALACGYMVFNASRSDAAGEFYIADEISVDGPAIFYEVSGETRRELWAVYCTQPLRSCVARSPGLVLRVDDSGTAWLIAVTSPDARTSIQVRNFTKDVKSLFSTPLHHDHIKELSEKDAFLIIEEMGTTVLRRRTTGMDRVIDYLTWIQGNTARTLRDARLWPRNGEILIQDMTPEVLERYEVMQRRALEAQKQLVPSTKPQIEFAIQAQNGESFFDPTGRGRN